MYVCEGDCVRVFCVRVLEVYVCVTVYLNVKICGISFDPRNWQK